MVFECRNSGWDVTVPVCAEMPTWDTSDITDINSLFAGASSFNIDISRWDTSSVTNMNGLFNGASSFNIDISGWDVSNVQSMNWMFWGATSFNVNLSSWNTRSIEGTLQMFDDSPKLSLSDVNECLLENRCNVYAACQNTDGSFVCTCNNRSVDWSLISQTTNCDEDQCASGSHDCAAHATCTDTEGSFSCACDTGFNDWSLGMKGTSCEENQCISGTHNCVAHATCNDNDGSFTCECNSGWKEILKKTSTCDNVDECDTEIHNCDEENTVCRDTAGSFICIMRQKNEREKGIRLAPKVPASLPTTSEPPAHLNPPQHVSSELVWAIVSVVIVIMVAVIIICKKRGI